MDRGSQRDNRKQTKKTEVDFLARIQQRGGTGAQQRDTQSKTETGLPTLPGSGGGGGARARARARVCVWSGLGGTGGRGDGGGSRSSVSVSVGVSAREG